MGIDNDLVERLRQLLEAERAGVFTARALLAEAKDDGEIELLERVLDGERESCRILGRLILRSEKRTGNSVGDFYKKVLALDGPVQRLNLLVKGQEWVVRKVDEAMELSVDPPLTGELSHIRQVHIDNIGECRKYLADLR